MSYCWLTQIHCKVKAFIHLIFLATVLISCSPSSQLSRPTETSTIATYGFTSSATTSSDISLSFTSPIEPTATPIPSPTLAPEVRLLAVGDMMLARTIGDNILRSGPDYPFQFVADVLDDADLVIGNLETAISTKGIPAEKTYTFRAPIEAASSLQIADFDLVSLANNHVLDYGEEAFFETMDVLSKAGIAYTGAGEDFSSSHRAIILERNGVTIAFLAYLDIPVWKYDYTQWQALPGRPGIAWGFHYDITADVTAASQVADLVIVMMHFGNEYESLVSQAQRDSAHAAIDAGAVLVIGSHPHVLQEIEQYQQGVIIYSMGNFLFDQFSGKSNESAILDVTLTATGIQDYRLIPVQIQPDGRPSFIN